jgi:hypothetical protein
LADCEQQAGNLEIALSTLQKVKDLVSKRIETIGKPSSSTAAATAAAKQLVQTKMRHRKDQAIQLRIHLQIGQCYTQQEAYMLALGAYRYS